MAWQQNLACGPSPLIHHIQYGKWWVSKYGYESFVAVSCHVLYKFFKFLEKVDAVCINWFQNQRLIIMLFYMINIIINISINVPVKYLNGRFSSFRLQVSKKRMMVGGVVVVMIMLMLLVAYSYLGKYCLARRMWTGNLLPQQSQTRYIIF